jgi:hypothetical protein
VPVGFGPVTWVQPTILGTAGMAAARQVPALLAILDQHAAAVRDSVGDGWAVPGPPRLSAADFGRAQLMIGSGLGT